MAVVCKEETTRSEGMLLCCPTRAGNLRKSESVVKSQKAPGIPLIFACANSRAPQSRLAFVGKIVFQAGRELEIRSVFPPGIENPRLIQARSSRSRLSFEPALAAFRPT